MTDRLDHAHWSARLAALAERHGVPGAQLGILLLDDDGEDRRLETATGVLSVRTGFPVTPDALFQIGSITKVWTATLIMVLVDDGRLRLDEPVAEILPGFALGDADTARALTVRHLLTHTGGIDGDIFIDTGRGDDCVERYVEQLATAEQSHPIGATWSYCNSGYVLLGRIVEVVTGMGWDAALRDLLIRPLGLSRTATLPEDVLLHPAAIGHHERDDGPTVVPVWHMPRSSSPAGVISAAAGDVLAFAELHLRGGIASDGSRLLSAESAAAMTARQVDLPDAETLGDSWGLGWIRFDWSGHRLYGHDGNTIGQAAFLRILPERRLAVTLLANGGRTRDLYEDLYREIFAELAGIEMRRPFEPATEAPAEIGDFAGRYERAGIAIDIEDGDDGPILRSTASGPIAALLPNPVQEFPLVAARSDILAVRPPGAQTWIPVTFYALPTGERYVHFGARAARKVG
ncbi:CubicO group peptidase, beta-lactamase class C family [Microbacterium sp. cf046]|uniref:serine hydrolase domain-containing protein n=1 Tax=Microbacterium sp. cf046 TaxID=1761803 RepID=UPI0008E6BE89|nr:serine hydrolase domain-containing protein [Microbacterium sp. cf046]SFR91905.1 CubicO group peptidase, beta-lactamase class C family [Microbacterium sp. cf046]